MTHLKAENRPNNYENLVFFRAGVHCVSMTNKSHVKVLILTKRWETQI